MLDDDTLRRINNQKREHSAHPFKASAAGMEDFVVLLRRFVDFDEARIDGTVKAPEGFFLRSRSANKAENIMNFRKNFQQRVRTVGHEGLRAVPMN
jgi:hypothetical protein